jgi:regulator of protease activity HflC (stomatin/prohibitin superfamily)
MVSVDVRILYRVGLTDRDAFRATYRTADSEALVRGAGGRQLAYFFAASTLEQVLGADREAMTEGLRTALQKQLDAEESGIELLSVVIEAIHPPSGAAAAYHNVQAAEILANTSISTEKGRAVASENLALQEAKDGADKAAGAAAETIGDALTAQWRFDADYLANRSGGQAFLLERYLTNLSVSLAKAPLVIMDHRLGPPNTPYVDLRALGAAVAPTGVENED